MNTTLKRTFLSVSLLISAFVYASFNMNQSELPFFPDEDYTISGDSLKKAESGTFEMISLSKQEELFTMQAMDELLVKIENNRHKSKVITIKISEYTAVKIYPRNDIYGEKLE